MNKVLTPRRLLMIVCIATLAQKLLFFETSSWLPFDPPLGGGGVARLVSLVVLALLVVGLITALRSSGSERPDGPKHAAQWGVAQQGGATQQWGVAQQPTSTSPPPPPPPAR